MRGLARIAALVVLYGLPFVAAGGEPAPDLIEVQVAPGDSLVKSWPERDPNARRPLKFIATPVPPHRFVAGSAKVVDSAGFTWTENANTETKAEFTRAPNGKEPKDYRATFSGVFKVEGPGTGPPPTWTVVTGRGQLVDLAIHNGQRGSEVPEDKEETVGAFTAANLNDTDGDTKVDNGDDDVTATAKGRDEVDLMRLVLRKPDPDRGGKVKLKIKSGNVKLWKFETKKEPVTDLEFPTSDLPLGTGLALWVEATAISADKRDIEIELSYHGAKDTVKATGVWAKKTLFLNAGDQTNIPADADLPAFKANIASFGNKFGVAHVSPLTNNGMLMEFQVMPKDIGNESQVVFDVTRRKESIGWDWTGENRVEVNILDVVPSTFPPKVEDTNDDGLNSDEDNAPMKDHIYSSDFPGFETDVADRDRTVLRFNFTEFVRIKVDGAAFKNQNGDAEGSRSSEEVPWRSRMDVVKDAATAAPRKWKRNGADNEIVEGHKALGGPP